MAVKPNEKVLKAFENRKKNPNFAKDTLRTIINETPALKTALVEAGLVTVVDYKEV